MLVRQARRNKLSSYFEPHPYVITDMRGTMVTVQRADGRTTTSNISFFKRVPPDINTSPHRASEESEVDDELWLDPPADVEPLGQPCPPPAPPDNADAGRRYPARQRQQPARVHGAAIRRHSRSSRSTERLCPQTLRRLMIA